MAAERRGHDRGNRARSWKGRSSRPGSLRIDGQVKGQINADGDVMLSPQSQVEADIHAQNVVVGGRFKGSIVVKGKAELARGGRVDGNITSKTLTVEEGAIFQGQSIMDQTPAATSAAAQTSAATRGRPKARARPGSEGAVVLDIKAIREDPEPFRAGLARRNLAEAVDQLLARTPCAAAHDAGRGAARRQNRRRRRSAARRPRRSNGSSQRSGKLGGAEGARAAADRGRGATRRAPRSHAEHPHECAPDGFTDEDAVEVRRHGEPPRFDFEPKDHVTLGEPLGVLDIERGARTSGSRFVYLMGDIVHIQFALVRHALDILTAKGFLPVIPPVLVREEAMYGTGFLPTDEVNIYVTATTICTSSAPPRSRSPRCGWAR